MIPKVGISEGKEPLFYNESHHAWREEVRKFVSKEIAPFVEEWEEAGEFPRELYKKAADVGLTGASPNNLVYIDGKADHKLSNKDLVDSLEKLIRKKAKKISLILTKKLV